MSTTIKQLAEGRAVMAVAYNVPFSLVLAIALICFTCLAALDRPIMAFVPLATIAVLRLRCRP